MKPSQQWLEFVRRGKTLGFNDKELEMFEVVVSTSYGAGGSSNPNLDEVNARALELKAEKQTSPYWRLEVFPRVLKEFLVWHEYDGTENVDVNTASWMDLHFAELTADTVEAWKLRRVNIGKLDMLVAACPFALSAEEPPAAEQPSAAKEPPATEQPSAIEQPPATEQPSAIEQPPAIEQPSAIEQPPADK